MGGKTERGSYRDRAGRVQDERQRADGKENSGS